MVLGMVLGFAEITGIGDSSFLTERKISLLSLLCDPQ